MLPRFTRAVFGRQAESGVHEQAAGNKEVGRNETMGDFPAKSPQPVPCLRQIELDQASRAFHGQARRKSDGIVFRRAQNARGL